MRYIFDISAMNDIWLPEETTGNWTAKQTEGGTWALNGFDGEYEIILSVNGSQNGAWDIVILDIPCTGLIGIHRKMFGRNELSAANRWVNDILIGLLREQPIDPPPLAA